MAGSLFRSTGAPTTALQSMFMQQMAPDIFVRILRGMGACRKKPAQPASGTLSWMTPSETLLPLILAGLEKSLPNNVFSSWLLSVHGPFSRTKTLRKRHHKGPVVLSVHHYSTSGNFRSPRGDRQVLSHQLGRPLWRTFSKVFSASKMNLLNLSE